MAGQTLAETQKIANGPPGSLRDHYRQHLASNGNTLPSTMTNAQIAVSGAGFWPDMVKQNGGTGIVSP